ncbi:MAG TPA: amidohydrolase family protein [Patescibacteria group bacterium]|nr:amidohydrolase family protein [Patescibacteria group bacterium]
MQGKIAVEEHFAFQESVADAERVAGRSPFWPVLKRRLVEFDQERLEEMDKAGIEFSVLALNSPAAQGMLSAKGAVDFCRRANDFLAEQVAKHPDRLVPLAAVPMQDPDAAAQELTRCVKDLGFKGTLVHGYTHQEGVADSAVYYDLPQYLPFWAQVEQLGVPFYLHPRQPLPSQQLMYQGHPWLMSAAWAFGVETATHTLRLICSGLFDRYPKLNVIVGHLGEGLPFMIWRVDHTVTRIRQGITIKKKPSDYLRSNFYLTTSGNFHTLSMIDAMLEIGSDRILFAVDYPFQRMDEGAEWFDGASINDLDKLKIGRLNSLKLFNVPVAESTHATAG